MNSSDLVVIVSAAFFFFQKHLTVVCEQLKRVA